MTNNTLHLKYDVFVSFRGEDIRQGFLSHLVKVFSRKQINAFVDDKLKRGDDISHSLVQAIEGSFISLIIFSENYASSCWCLKELEKIIERKENYGQIVIPVFYGVDPTNVRHQKKSYENAFAELERKYNLSEVQIWRRALKISANSSGITSSSFKNEADLLEEITKVVLMSLSKNPVNSKGLIGIDKSIAHLESLLRKESKKVRVIGICGMGGIGKTTIAEEIFSQNRSEYDGGCFLPKVSDELTRNGLKSLKENLFSTLLVEDVKMDTPNRLSSDIERRISRMKVLIVLDDVKDTDQLEMLFGTLDWFRSDSRIIVTTRDKQVLIANEVDDIHEVGVLNSNKALELFNLNAFERNNQLEMEDYCELSKRFVHYASGIPLVLKILGHLLRGKDKQVWESMLDKLKREPIKKVYHVMRLSYDDLDRLEQKIFLDIACFFNGLNLKVDYMKLLLKDCESDNSVAVGLERLTDRALVTISKDNVVSMHDIIQEIGREIVRQESSKDPGSCSRLYDPDDICDVLQNDKGTEAVRSISVDLLAIRNLRLSPHVFAKMSKLKFLDFHGKYDSRDIPDFSNLLPQGLQYLPTDLRYVQWMHYPLDSLPDKFSAENLVILDLSFSRVVKLWCGVQNMASLKEVKLSRSELLRELPDFSEATNLEVLDLSFCRKLTSVHPSIFSVNKLQKLDLFLCGRLTEFTSNAPLSSLRYLNLGLCHSLRKLSVKAENITELNLAALRIDACPSTFGCQTKLEILNLEFSEIEDIHSRINNLTRIRHLNLRYCMNLRTLPELPSSVEIQLAEGCSLLETILFPLTAAEQLKENKKSVEFWNCMNLSEVSLRYIRLNAQINLMRSVHQHAPEHDIDDYKHNFASYQALYVYPGSSVPEWIEFKTTKNHMIINLSTARVDDPLLGIIFCFILGSGYNKCDQIELGITTVNDIEKEGVRIYMTRPYFAAYMDHVCMIYDQPSSRYLTSLAKTQTRFKINVTARSRDGPEFDALVVAFPISSEAGEEA
ncbi:TIR-NBS-LRR resistance protein [Trifolium pratense]|uniref:TIR-NBS-LRR resistance protein n=1 Tax=Trifolium pratense TaxID=57577 RepID=A0A2K3P4R3_TRIPR|nr:TIR-NBS-LRR resistance protein [Trifolium pratense]